MSQVKQAALVLDPDNWHVFQGNVSQAPSHSRFPQEIFDNIIDHIDGEADGRLHGLHTCSLVSRAWAASTAYHLFYRIHWPLCIHSHHPIPDQEKFRDGSRSCPLALDGHGPAVLQALLVEFPRVYNNIRDLRLEFPHVFPPMPQAMLSGTTLSLDFKAVPTKTTLPELLSMVDLTPQLRSLKLSNATVQEYDSRQLGFLATLRRTRDLSALTIDSGSEDKSNYSAFNTVSISDFLRRFTRIRTLRLSRLQQNRNGLYPQPWTPAPDASATLQVQTLVFHDCFLAGISNTLSAMQTYLDVSALTTLELGANFGPHNSSDLVLARVLPAFLRRALNLEVMACGAHLYPFLRAFAPPTLRELRLRSEEIMIYGSGDRLLRRRQSWPVISDVPAQLFVPGLRAVCVELQVVYSPWVDPSRASPDPKALRIAFEVELRDIFYGYDWGPFEDIAQRVEACTFRVRFRPGPYVHITDELGTQKYLDTIRSIASARMPESVQGVVRIEVSRAASTDA